MKQLRLQTAGSTSHSSWKEIASLIRGSRIPPAIDIQSAELEILAQKQEATHPIANQQRQQVFWEQMTQQGEEIAEQLEYGINKSAEPIHDRLPNLAEHWKLITICPKKHHIYSYGNGKNTTVTQRIIKVIGMVQQSEVAEPYVPCLLLPEKINLLQSGVSE
ncbi:unnamed protein product [Onchocerca ochengi]|uniref:Gag protein n=1 Tax=Onchocerca ochengi TaxID=42157 RepID=A0A182ETL7_ONCOC|nr:unnamed protein product [Onchocerca ochengi]